MDCTNSNGLIKLYVRCYFQRKIKINIEDFRTLARDSSGVNITSKLKFVTYPLNWTILHNFSWSENDGLLKHTLNSQNRIEIFEKLAVHLAPTEKLYPYSEKIRKINGDLSDYTNLSHDGVNLRSTSLWYSGKSKGNCKKIHKDPPRLFSITFRYPKFSLFSFLPINLGKVGNVNKQYGK